MKNRSFWKILTVAVALSGCGSSGPTYLEKPAEQLYGSATALMQEKKYIKAADILDEIDRQHPYSNCASKAQLLSGFCAFKAGKYPRAIATFDVFIELHPTSPSIAYAYYLRAMAYYMDMRGLKKDQENTHLAMGAFQEILTRFPTTEYAHDAQIKIDFISEHLASHDMLIAKSYLLDRRYVAAWMMFSGFLKDWPRSILTPEVLYRLIECQVSLGMVAVSDNALKVLQHNFPKSVWTARACALIKGTKQTPIKK